MEFSKILIVIGQWHVNVTTVIISMHSHNILISTNIQVKIFYFQ